METENFDIDAILDPPEEYDDYEEDIFIGEIEFIDALDEETIGDVNLKGIGTCKIILHSKEGDIPHFHVKNEKFNSCIRLDTNEYFDHGDNYKDTLSNKQSKQLEKYMNTTKSWSENKNGGKNLPEDKVEDIKVWEWMKRKCQGSSNNNKYPVVIGLQPNYSTINPKGTLKSEKEQEDDGEQSDS